MRVSTQKRLLLDKRVPNSAIEGVNKLWMQRLPKTLPATAAAFYLVRRKEIDEIFTCL
jgi:hypothetical protein